MPLFRLELAMAVRLNPERAESTPHAQTLIAAALMTDFFRETDYRMSDVDWSREVHSAGSPDGVFFHLIAGESVTVMAEPGWAVGTYRIGQAGPRINRVFRVAEDSDELRRTLSILVQIGGGMGDIAPTRFSARETE